MQYDLVKDRLERIVGDSALLRRLFFAALDRLFLRSRYIAREIKRLKKQKFNPTEILDAGSGFGQYTIRLARSFPEARIIGLDVKQEQVDSGNRLIDKMDLHNAAFIIGDLLTMEEENRYDLALSVDVLEHIEDDRKVIANIARSLKPGGLFMLTTPYFDGVHPSAAVYIDEHVRPGYSWRELSDKMSEAGLDLQRFEITYGPWGNIGWKLLQKWPMGWLHGRTWLLPLVGLYFCFAYPVAWVCMYLDMNVGNPNGGGIMAIGMKRR
ncbi:MAG: class I SAM-dependent methyltransferase [bacterium]|nr:class I SAM-dependent methyltransferase [bacterium]